MNAELPNRWSAAGMTPISLAGGEPGSLVGTMPAGIGNRSQDLQDLQDPLDPQEEPVSPNHTRTRISPAFRHRPILTPWRREALRTTLWLVPTVLCLAAVVLFAGTYTIDRLSYDRGIHLPSILSQTSPDAARTVLGAAAGALITVTGVLFSVMIVAFTLASQQFGPRMLRNFIRDLGTQFSLGVYVASFVYTVLTLGSVGASPNGTFVPRLSIAVAELSLIVDTAVLIYFVHHIAVSIQLQEVMAGISRDLRRAIDVQFPLVEDGLATAASPLLAEQTLRRMEGVSATVPATTSGYLQFVRREELIAIAADTDAVIELLYRPGHFVTAGLPLARVWPAAGAPAVAAALARAHVSGAHRTLTQDPVFPVDQLVEIAIRALSAAINDTFTALTCIDWLADALCRISTRALPQTLHCDSSGIPRLIERPPDYARIVNRAVDKIRQAGGTMPAVAIRQIDALTKVVQYTISVDQREVLARQVTMWGRAAVGISDPDDRDDVERRIASFEAMLEQHARGTAAPLDVLDSAGD